ncbi:hypothetical protein ABT294_32210 [Nonomuraea sp. NPDC000554]
MSDVEFHFPATSPALRAREFVERVEAPFLVNHSIRRYLFGRAVVEQRG